MAGQRGLRNMPPALERDRSDALWAEMQATLGEVELSASNGTHVFGRDHDRKLAELRAAQIALAQAWARSEADDAIETNKNKEAKIPGLGDAEGSKSIGSGVQRPSTSGGPSDKLGAKLQEETEVDMLLARKRREANDIYFDRVNRGVLDVVAKLSDVATAMSAVERESRDIWNDGDGVQEAK
ncbi:hypothetical protein TD95_004502 [Thielaviopsis punctulata]|uniref:Uncharacterized protein n=1 Tax=Thielaviopsis punctulata TaxID=72032 RepID=A0A0F4ZI09_9PEZI|nr:hypothetical protein TD95_004502 [Thielaviopsis punctulata]